MNKQWQQKLAKGLIAALMLAMIPVIGLSPVYAVQYQFNTASLELSDSAPGEVADWTLTIENVTAIEANDKIVITPADGEFTIPAGMDYEDLDLDISGDITLAATPGTGAASAWGVSVTSGTSGSITLTNNDTDTIAAASTIEIQIGTNAASGVEQITNPAKDAAVGTADIWTVDVTSQDSSNADATMDTIDLPVAIVESVDLTGAQTPQMTFEISGETAPSGGAVSANAIEWRELSPGTAKTATLRAKVNTDAFNGFTVYVRQNNNMQHSEDSGIDIDAWTGTNGSPTTWASPAGTTIGVNTGYLGYTTSDSSLSNTGDGVDRFTSGGPNYAGLTATSQEVLFHNEASQSNVDGQDYADVTFQIETNNLQPSGNYSNEITFIAVPIF